MPYLTSPAIMLRAIDHGDYDKVITFFTLRQGKISVIAKGAKKSIKRFAGILELFSILDLVWRYGQTRGMPTLKEASLIHPFEQIRKNITTTAYASYWCELVYIWMEQGQRQPSLYRLLEYVLAQLDAGDMPEQVLHITFQLRFMAISGFRPGLDYCSICRKPVDRFGRSFASFDLRRGGILCEKCTPKKEQLPSLSIGTIKLLRWALNVPLKKLNRIRFSVRTIEESLAVVEPFVAYHLGKETKSLKFLKQLDSRLQH